MFSADEFESMTSASDQITRLLNAWAKGSNTAAEELFPLIEQELHQIAKEHMRRRRPGYMIQTTELVNEAYLRLVDGENWHDRRHFFAVASLAMRHILIDRARSDRRQKRRVERSDLPPEEALPIFDEPSRWLIALDDALHALAKLDPRAARVIELRFFGGLTVEETAEAMDLSPATVYKDWKSARLWLTREISGKSDES
jgi:RNA polymerase sigma-70 factor, ECF subfamily